MESHAYQFRTTNPNDQLGFVNDSSPLGAQPPNGQLIVDTIRPGNGDYETNYELDFAPSCAVTTDQNVALRWGDADDASSSPAGGTDGTEWAGDTNPSFTFFQVNPNGPSPAPIQIFHWKNGLHSTPDIGGNNDYNELPFTAHPGWKYRWVWNSVDSAEGAPNFGFPPNNIKMWLPYDSINYNLSCWDYHSSIASADSRANPSTLDFSNPADQTVRFWVDARNIGSGPGPTAHTTPTMSPGGWATLTTTDPSDPQVNNGDINTSINGLSSDTSYFGHGAKFEFKFDPLTPSGVYCFSDTIAPHNSTDPSSPSDNTICYTVKNDRRFPSVAGLNSDVHAGGGLCPSGQNSGTIQGNNGSGGASYGQYVVSAAPVGAVGGAINDFGSNGSPGSNKLNIGQTGGYQQECRRDLYAHAEQSKDLSDPNQHQLGSGAYTIDSSWSGIYYANGPIALSSSPGGVSNKITIVMESGDLSVTGDITLNAASAGPRDAPSLGIITDGPTQNVFIEPAVRNLNAYIFSDGTVDTCATAAVFAPPGCGNRLTIDGFIMAKSINFKRLAQNGTLGAQSGEQVELSPQLYLNPPYFFDAGSDSTSLQGLGEKQPLF